MKLNPLFIVVVSVAVTCGIWVMVNLPKSMTHKCIDLTHSVCETRCECESFGCPAVLARDYQIEIISQDTLAVYDRDKLVGKIPLIRDNIGDLILYDNR